MTVSKKLEPFPLSRPAVDMPAEDPPPLPPQPAAPTGPPVWLNGQRPEAWAYERAVQAAFRRAPQPNPEPEDDHGWVWD